MNNSENKKGFVSQDKWCPVRGVLGCDCETPPRFDAADLNYLKTLNRIDIDQMGRSADLQSKTKNFSNDAPSQLFRRYEQPG